MGYFRDLDIEIFMVVVIEL